MQFRFSPVHYRSNDYRDKIKAILEAEWNIPKNHAEITESEAHHIILKAATVTEAVWDVPAVYANDVLNSLKDVAALRGMTLPMSKELQEVLALINAAREFIDTQNYTKKYQLSKFYHKVHPELESEWRARTDGCWRTIQYIEWYFDILSTPTQEALKDLLNN